MNFVAGVAKQLQKQDVLILLPVINFLACKLLFFTFNKLLLYVTVVDNRLWRSLKSGLQILFSFFTRFPAFHILLGEVINRFEALVIFLVRQQRRRKHSTGYLVETVNTMES